MNAGELLVNDFDVIHETLRGGAVTGGRAVLELITHDT